MASSFSRSPSSILSTGTPVQRETTWAICSASTTSGVRGPDLSRLGGLGVGELFLDLGDLAVGDLAGAAEVAGALGGDQFGAQPVEGFAQLGAGGTFSFSDFQRR
jgi:hypothetical protein